MAEPAEVRTIVDEAADLIRSGAFDDAISGIIVDGIRSGSDDGLTEIGFVLKMAVELIDRSSPHMSFDDAKRLAGYTYQLFRKENRVKFGDADWDWSGRGAREVIHGYEIDYWGASHVR
jgi:hypothetical protein